MAYFDFNFRDVEKKHRRNLLSSILIQLSSLSEPRLDILSILYSPYKACKEQPGEQALVQCLKDMLVVSSLSQYPTYIILDALDECPNTPGLPAPREQVLGLVKDLVDLHLPNLHICITSRPEVDIRTALEGSNPWRLSTSPFMTNLDSRKISLNISAQLFKPTPKCKDGRMTTEN